MEKVKKIRRIGKEEIEKKTEKESPRRTLASTRGDSQRKPVEQLALNLENTPTHPQGSSQKNATPQERFNELMERCPLMAQYYDAKDRSFNVPQMKQDFPYRSPGQQTMLAFLKTLWDPHGSWFSAIDNYPILKNFSCLDHKHSRIIADWVTNPYWM